MVLVSMVALASAGGVAMALPASGSQMPSSSTPSTTGAPTTQLHPSQAALPESYWLVGSDGGVFSFGGAPFYGSEGGKSLTKPIVGMSVDLATGGYWLAASDGGVFSFDSPFNGSVPAIGIHTSDIVGMASTPDGKGYWLVGSDGGVFSFGDAGYFGSLPGQGIHVSNVVGVAATPDGKGYWLVGSDGGIFSFGDAGYYGSVPGEPPILCPAAGGCVSALPYVGMAATPDGKGYWLPVASGGISSFGDATYYGSQAGQTLTKPIVGMAGFGAGGYWLVGSDGGVFAFGNAQYEGSLPGSGVHVSDIVGIAAE
jgi:hypothetical protein